MQLNDVMHIQHDIGRYNVQLSLGSIVDSDRRRAAYTQGLSSYPMRTSRLSDLRLE